MDQVTVESDLEEVTRRVVLRPAVAIAVGIVVGIGVGIAIAAALTAVAKEYGEPLEAKHAATATKEPTVVIEEEE